MNPDFKGTEALKRQRGTDWDLQKNLTGQKVADI